MKPLQALIFGLICFGLGIVVVSCWPSDKAELEDPVIHKLQEEIGWRSFKEAKIKDSLKIERAEKKALSKDVITEREKLRKAEIRYAEVRKVIPLTRKDTIVFLMRDTVACDSALLRAKELVGGLTIEISTDNAIIKNLDSLNTDLQSDKIKLTKIDSLNQIEKKKIRKKGRKRFFKGLGIGGVLGAILALIL